MKNTIKIKNESLQCKVNTRFMENYNLSSNYQLGIKPHVIENVSGNLEAYMLNKDFYVERFYVDPNSPNGYSLETLSLSGSDFTLCKDKDGRIVIFAANAASVYCTVEESAGSGQFCKPFTIKGTYPVNSQKVVNLCSRLFDGEIWIGALIEVGPSASEVDTFALYGKWRGEETTLHNSGYSISGGSCNLMENDNGIWLITGLNSLIGINMNDNSIFRFPKLPGKVTDVCIGVNACQEDIVFAATKELGYFSYKSSDWIHHATGDTYVQLESLTDAEGNIWLFGLSSKSEFQYAIFSDDNMDMSVIDTNIGFVADYQGIATYPTAFCIRKNYKLMTQFIFEDNSHTWSAQQIAFSSTEMAYACPAYSSEIIMLDENDVPMPQQSLWLWSKDATRVAFNGNICYLDGSNKKVRVETDSYGKLNVIQETDVLAIPDLFVSFSPTDDENYIQIKQYAVVQDSFNSISKEQLYEAKKHDGTYLLSDKYRTNETAESLSNAIHQCMNMFPQVNGQSMKGFCMLRPNEWKYANMLNTEAPDFCWSIERNGNNLTYRAYQSHEMEMVIKSMMTNALGWNPFKFIGDIVKAAAKKVIDVVKLVVSKVGDVVKAAVNFIMDGVKHFAECVISTVQEVFHTVETFFQEVKIAFKDLFQWLGFIFDWEDILRTKRAVSYLVDESVNLLSGICGYVCDRIDPMIESIIGNLEEAIDGLIARIDPNANIGDCINGKAYNGQITPELEESLSNNIIMNRFIDTDLESMSLQIENYFAAQSNAQSKAADDFISIVTNFISPFKDNEDFQKAIKYFDKILSGKGNIFANTICGLLKMLKGISALMLKGVSALVKGLFKCFISILDTLKELMNKEIKLPFLSSLYEKITDEKLTLQEIPCLLISIPLTILFKIVDKRSPFPDNKSLDKFKQDVNAKMIIDSLYANINKGVNKIHISDEYIISFLTKLGAISAGIYYMTSTVGDIALEGMNLFHISIITFLAELSWDITSAITLFSNDFNAADIVNYAVIATGLVFDILSIYGTSKMPENTENKYLQWATFGYGIASATTAIVAICCGKNPSSTIAAIITSLCTPFIIMSKIGLKSTVIAATDGISKVVVLAIDNIAIIGMPIGLSLS